MIERVEERARIEDGDDPVAGIGPAALHGLALDAGEAPVAPHPEPEANRLLGTAPVGDEGLFAGGHEAHRTAGLAGEEGADDLDVEGLGAAAEAAPDVRLHHPDPRLLQVEAAREHQVHVVGHLGARVHREPAALRVVVREGRVHLHLSLADLGAAIGLLPHEVGAGKRRVHIPELELDVPLEVAGALLVEVDRAGGERRLGRVVRGQLLDLDPDEGERARGRRIVVRGDRRDRLAPIPDPAAGEGGTRASRWGARRRCGRSRPRSPPPAPRGGLPPRRCRRTGSPRAPRGFAGCGPRARRSPEGPPCSGRARSPCPGRPPAGRTRRWSGRGPARLRLMPQPPGPPESANQRHGAVCGGERFTERCPPESRSGRRWLPRPSVPPRRSSRTRCSGRCCCRVPPGSRLRRGPGPVAGGLPKP